MTLPNLRDRRPDVNCEVTVKDECQWKARLSDLFVVARGGLQSVNFHLSVIIVSDEGLWNTPTAYLGTKVALFLSPNNPIIGKSLHIILEVQEVAIIA